MTNTPITRMSRKCRHLFERAAGVGRGACVSRANSVAGLPKSFRRLSLCLCLFGAWLLLGEGLNALGISNLLSSNLGDSTGLFSASPENKPRCTSAKLCQLWLRRCLEPDIVLEFPRTWYASHNTKQPPPTSQVAAVGLHQLAKQLATHPSRAMVLGHMTIQWPPASCALHAQPKRPTPLTNLQPPI